MKVLFISLTEVFGTPLNLAPEAKDSIAWPQASALRPPEGSAPEFALSSLKADAGECPDGFVDTRARKRGSPWHPWETRRRRSCLVPSEGSLHDVLLLAASLGAPQTAPDPSWQMTTEWEEGGRMSRFLGSKGNSLRCPQTVSHPNGRDLLGVTLSLPRWDETQASCPPPGAKDTGTAGAAG